MTREIGEEYWGEWIADTTSTRLGESRVKWRVIEIVRVHKYGIHGEHVDAERIEGIAVEHR